VETVFETDFNEKIQKPSMLCGQLCEQARWIESCAVNGYPSGQDGAIAYILPAQGPSRLPAVSCKKNFSASHILNPSLTKLVLSRWLDIGVVLFLASLWTSTLSLSINTQKNTWPISSHLELTLDL